MSRRGHTITIPDWVWEWAEEEFKQPNPGSHLSDLLAKTVSNILKLRQSPKQETPGEPKKSRDKGKPMIAGHDSFCGLTAKCQHGKVCPKGSWIVMFEGKSYHLECFSELNSDKAA